MLKNKKILIIIGGGIAAYKSLDLIRLLKKNNVEIKTILTKSGREFVTPLSLTTLAKSKRSPAVMYSGNCCETKDIVKSPSFKDKDPFAIPASAIAASVSPSDELSLP